MSGWCIDVISTFGHYHASLLVFLITSTQWRILLHLRKNSKVRLLYLVHNANGFTITWENVLWDMNCVRHADSKTSTLIKRDLFLHKTLTHQHLVPHICVSELIKHWFKKWLVACSAPRHYLNQSWVIVSWTLTNKLQWNSVNKAFHSWTCNWKSRLPKWRPFCPGGGGGGGWDRKTQSPYPEQDMNDFIITQHTVTIFFYRTINYTWYVNSHISTRLNDLFISSKQGGECWEKHILTFLHYLYIKCIIFCT